MFWNRLKQWRGDPSGWPHIADPPSLYDNCKQCSRFEALKRLWEWVVARGGGNEYEMSTPRIHGGKHTANMQESSDPTKMKRKQKI